MKKHLLFLFIFCLSISIFTYAQNSTPQLNTQPQNSTNTPPSPTVNNSPQFCKEIEDANHYVLLPAKGLALLFFYSPKNEESLKMLTLMENLKLKFQVQYFCVNSYTNNGLNQTYNVNEVPSIIITQDRKVIYATTGFVDDLTTLTSTLEEGIKNNLLITQTP